MKLAGAVVLLTIATPLLAGSQVSASHAALATPYPGATRVGVSILERGGNAIDAAVAVALVLSVVQPETASIGGGGYLMYFDAKSGAVWSLDFREVSPIEAKGDTTLHAATPGFLAGLNAMHKKFGALKWRALVEPAAAAAREATKGDLAATLLRTAELGARELYDGSLTGAFITAVKNGGGAIGHRDLHDYEPVWRAPIRVRFGDYDIFAPAPPSSGGIELAEALNIVGGLDLAASRFGTAKSLHLITESERRASIDAMKTIGDPTYARIPYRDLLSPEHGTAWRGSIKADKVTPTVLLTDLPQETAPSRTAAAVTITDAAGNVAAMTTSGGAAFVVPGMGFPLNDAMKDFRGETGPNSFASSKRPLTAMSPVIVLRNGRPYVALADATPATVLQVLLNIVVYKKPLYDAIAAPRYRQRAAPDQIEYEQTLAPKAIVDALNAMGHAVVARDAVGDVNGLIVERGKITAVADPRHGGAAGGR